MIGNYESVAARPARCSTSLAQLAAWKLVDLRPRPAGLDPGHVRGQRQVPLGQGRSACRSSTATATPTTPRAPAATSTPSSATCARPRPASIAAATLKLKKPFAHPGQRLCWARRSTVVDGKFKPQGRRRQLPVDAQRRADRGRHRLDVRRDARPTCGRSLGVRRHRQRARRRAGLPGARHAGPVPARCRSARCGPSASPAAR